MFMFNTKEELVVHYEKLAEGQGLLFDSLAYEDPEKNTNSGYAFAFDVHNDCSFPIGEFAFRDGVYYAL